MKNDTEKNTKYTQITKFLGPTWDPPGSYRPQMGPMLAPWTLLSGCELYFMRYTAAFYEIYSSSSYDITWHDLYLCVCWWHENMWNSPLSNDQEILLPYVVAWISHVAMVSRPGHDIALKVPRENGHIIWELARNKVQRLWISNYIA